MRGRAVALASRAARWLERRAVGDAGFAERALRRGAVDRNGYYDLLTDAVMRRVLAPDAVCVDVGAHRGALLERMLHHAPRGRFLAFEPLPDEFAELSARFAGERVHVLELALSDTPGRVTFNHVVTNPGYSGMLRRRYDRPHEVDRTIMVDVETLDAVAAAHGIAHVDFVKIDVEGAETLVLRGARRLLRASRPVIVFEHGVGTCDGYGHGPDDVHDLLDDVGLRVSLLPGFLRGKPSLDRDGFRAASARGEYYFVAHPAC
jgi:FkbM family methyltransferase